MDFDAYYEKILARMFPRRLNLRISKRYTRENRERMEKLYDELLEPGTRKPFDIAEKYLPVVTWESLRNTRDAARFPHVAFTNESVDRVNDWAQDALRQTREWRVGDVANGKTFARVKGKRLFPKVR